MTEKKINCFQCQHFFVTWDKHFPRGCKAFGFKGPKLPSQMVREASGKECGAFLAKEKNEEEGKWMSRIP